MDHFFAMKDEVTGEYSVMTLEEISSLTKSINAKPTLVPTGIKCQMAPNTSLELYVRSSAPLKNWLMLANGVGVVDADYYNNIDNEGEIFFQVINLSPFPSYLKRAILSAKASSANMKLWVMIRLLVVALAVLAQQVLILANILALD